MLVTWRQCCLWSLPYYLVGATLAGLAVNQYQAGSHLASLAMLPSMYLVYIFYQVVTHRLDNSTAAPAVSKY